MRLIDADELKETINNVVDEEIKFKQSWAIGLKYSLKIIDNAPTVEERPQGEWKFIQGATTQGSLKCPFCDYRDYHKTNSNFCPNCGAKMREV